MSRKVIIAVDNSDDDVKSARWAVDNVLRHGDEVHLLHIVPRLSFAAQYGAPPVEMLPQQDPQAYERMLQEAEAFIQQRFVVLFTGQHMEPIVHLIKAEVDANSIGKVICSKATDLHAAAVVLAKHNRGRVHDFFMGSVCKYCVQHCPCPTIVVH